MRFKTFHSIDTCQIQFPHVLLQFLPSLPASRLRGYPHQHNSNYKTDQDLEHFIPSILVKFRFLTSYCSFPSFELPVSEVIYINTASTTKLILRFKTFHSFDTCHVPFSLALLCIFLPLQVPASEVIHINTAYQVLPSP